MNSSLLTMCVWLFVEHEVSYGDIVCDYIGVFLLLLLLLFIWRDGVTAIVLILLLLTL